MYDSRSGGEKRIGKGRELSSIWCTSLILLGPEDEIEIFWEPLPEILEA